MGSNEGCVWVSLGGVGHVEKSEGFFGLTMSMEENSLYMNGILCFYDMQITSTTQRFQITKLILHKQ